MITYVVLEFIRFNNENWKVILVTQDKIDAKNCEEDKECDRKTEIWYDGEKIGIIKFED
jgi:hypothetical protein